MGNNEAATPSKTEKLPSPVQLQEQPALHPYADWAAMQAYYGPGMMHPYFSTSVVPGYAPHPYMWAPRPLVPPFGSPYAAMYPNGAYPHASMPLGSHAPHPGATEAVVMATPLNVEAPDISLGCKDKWLVTKLNATVGNKSSKNASGAHGNELSQSGYNSADGSSNGSDGSNSAGGSSNHVKVGSEDRPSSDERNIDSNINPANGGGKTSSKVSFGVSGTPTDIAGNRVKNKASPGPAQPLVVKNTGTPVPSSAIPMMPGCNGVPSELWIQDERTLKREKRKQSNRESARRSRLRKQAENEELGKKVDTLVAENTNLRSEISQLISSSDALRTENSVLLKKLKNLQTIHAEEPSLPNAEIEGAPSIVAVNLLSMIDKPNSISSGENLEAGSADDPDGKLQQLLDTNPRTEVAETVLTMIPVTVQDK
ncbi:G-box-binding factor 3-like isoform X1 [Zingiber officinale]|uniref:G-box-binding factor 3-like isoform X1 n=1 Tax=Zingiber officinale TaxID=94328 RepID=UPI001C4C4D7F|nr:G-box-binding factor 3-like isoform X1 [Zingiber officinale]